MAQVTDRNIGANPTGFAMRTEINNIIAALESDNSGSSEPLNTVAYMKWLDTSNATYYYVKERNHDNTAWVTLFRYTVATKIMEAVSNGVVLDYSTVVNKTGDETISGIKTFSSSPIVPTPTADMQAATKKYVDDKQANLGFTPVQQGTGIGQLPNVVKIGWSPENRLKVTVDFTDLGNIVMDGNIGVANSSLVKTALNASGSAPIYACRAWVNFNGTGTVAIRASGNVSSITDNGVGDYTVNFATAMPDANYSVSVSGGTGSHGFYQGGTIIYSTSSFRFRTVAKNIGISDAPNFTDMNYVTVSIFR